MLLQCFLHASFIYAHYWIATQCTHEQLRAKTKVTTWNFAERWLPLKFIRSIVQSKALTLYCWPACSLLFWLLGNNNKYGQGMLFKVGFLISSVHAARYAYMGESTLLFENYQQHRFFRVKQKLPYVCKSALIEFTIITFLYSFIFTSPIQQSCTGILACTFLINLSQQLVSVVLTEQLVFTYNKSQGLNTLFLSLESKNIAIKQLALLDLQRIAQNKDLRALIYDDVSGKQWQIVGSYCMQGIANLMNQLYVVVKPQKDNKEKQFTAKYLIPRKDWQSRSDYQFTWELLQVYQYVRQNAQQMLGYVRVLAALCRYAKTEDTYAVVMSGSPRLALVMAKLADLRYLAREYQKRIQELNSSHLSKFPISLRGVLFKVDCVDTVMFQIEEILERELFGLFSEYGQKSLDLVQEEIEFMGSYQEVVRDSVCF
eukprot:TRINITY_DN5591_c0_g1_i2.p2 TRINITY_DN5591_c0_g1~~TRINITY_DN5591_c0_g1_i2.p2  ORF type:complete len:498 (-),score=22.86 TRINITY_DN5591_c0_g1_i2:396-1682(-)